MRIGELSRATGVRPELLRVWERRYGLLRPARTPGGFREYSADDRRRVERMTELLAAGYPAAAAARLAEAAHAAGPVPAGVPERMVAELRRAARAYDEVAANAVLDEALGRFTVETVIEGLVMPFLRDLGTGWEAGEVSIGQEHFATALVRGRLLGLARSWGMGSGPRAILACPPGEQHDLGLIAFGLALREHGWRITLLGANTPLTTLAETARALAPDLVVIATVDDARMVEHRDEIAALAARVPTALAGPGVTAELARATGALPLLGSPTTAAARVVAAMTPEGSPSGASPPGRARAA
jgi:MerR family transcriptional regulator, light-induced transcriptional regulator